MTLKKMLLLAGMALAAVAYMAPAAQADEWFTHEKNKKVTIGGAAKPDKVVFTGSLTSTGGGLINGPCAVTANAEVWNEVFAGGVVTGTGKVTAVAITATPLDECATNVPGCGISSATVKNLPWHVNVLAGTGIDIEGANFRNTYTSGGVAGCAAAGIPHEIEATGTLTGQGVNKAAPVGFCIVFNNSGHLINDATTGAVTIDGELCAPNLTLG